MAFHSDDIEIFKLLVDYYGYPNSWETNHWMHFNAMFDVLLWVEECNSSNVAQIRDNRTKEVDNLRYENQTQLVSLKREAKKLADLAIKVLHVEGLEYDEKVFLGNKLMGDSRNLDQEFLNVMDERKSLSQDGIDNPRTLIPKKPVGRPSSKIIYRWMDHLVLELGSKQKAADYVSDSIMASSPLMMGSKNPDTLVREYRRYCKDKGEG